MEKWILAILALTMSACGGGGGTEQQSSSAPPPSGQSSSSSSGGSSTDDFCAFLISIYWCADDRESDASNAAAMHSQVSDTEPNDYIAHAVAVHWPRAGWAGQRIGFGVEGTVTLSSDVADFFAFTPQRSADFYISLCKTGQVCGPFNPDYNLPLTSASVRILDQFGVEVFSDELYPGSANYFEMRFESGTLYYAVVVAEGVGGAETSYRLTVGESLQQTEDGENSPASVPEAPQLSAFVLDSYTNVQFDWTPPTHNEDGSQLTDLAGFNLYVFDYVRDGDTAERRLIETIHDPTMSTRTISLAGYEDWHVSITAFNEAGVESAQSNSVELVTAIAAAKETIERLFPETVT